MNPIASRLLCVAQLTALFLVCLMGDGPALANSVSPDDQAGHPAALCHQAAREEERKHRIPRDLLNAIALTESGRWSEDADRLMAWPWTVMAEGKGRYFDSKIEAMAEVELLLSQGVRNIDVGCMQVNLHHHWWAFETLAEAFDPGANAAYAAEFLTQKRKDAPNWVTAAGHYHSKTPEFFKRYRDKVVKHWEDLKRAPFDLAALGPVEGETLTPTITDVPDTKPKSQFQMAPIDQTLTQRLNKSFAERRSQERQLGNLARRDSRQMSPQLKQWREDRQRGVRLQRIIAERRVQLKHQRDAKVRALTSKQSREEGFAAKRKKQLQRWRLTGSVRGDS